MQRLASAPGTRKLADTTVAGWSTSIVAHVIVGGILMLSYPHLHIPSLAGSRTSSACEIVVEMPHEPERAEAVEITSAAVATASPSPKRLNVEKVAEQAQPELVELAVVPTVITRLPAAASTERSEQHDSQSISAATLVEPIARRMARPISPSSTATSVPAVVGTQVDSPARPIHNPPPAYPATALADRREGLVMLRITVGSSGDVQRVHLEQSSGRSDFDKAAISAVRQWRFQPATQSGTPVEYHCRLPVRFSLS